MMDDVFVPGFPFEGPLAEPHAEGDVEPEPEADETEVVVPPETRNVEPAAAQRLRTRPAPPPERQPEAARAAAPARRVTSTAYCHTGAMASGRPTYAGAAAMNGAPLGSRYQVLTGPRAGETFVVEDRIGGGSEFDIAYPGDCPGARMYGRRVISIRRI